MDRKAYIRGYMDKLAAIRLPAYARSYSLTRSYNPMQYWNKLGPLPPPTNLLDVVPNPRVSTLPMAQPSPSDPNPSSWADTTQTATAIGAPSATLAGKGIGSAASTRWASANLPFLDVRNLRAIGKAFPQVGRGLGAAGYGINAAQEAGRAGQQLGSGNTVAGLGTLLSSGISGASTAAAIGQLAPAAMPIFAKFSPYAMLAANATDAARSLDPGYRKSQLDFYRNTGKGGIASSALEALQLGSNSMLNPVSGVANSVAQGRGMFQDFGKDRAANQGASQVGDRLRRFWTMASPEQRSKVAPGAISMFGLKQ